MGVQAGAPCCAANGQFSQVRQCDDDAGFTVTQRCRPARDFLPQRQRGGVLQVRAADLDDGGELRCLVLQRRGQAVQGGQQVATHRHHGSDVMGGSARRRCWTDRG